MRKANNVVALALLLTLFMMSNQTAFAQYECQPPNIALVTTGSLTATDNNQTGRIVRDANPSTCTGKTNLLQNSTLVKADSYNFTNPTGLAACVTVDFDMTGCNLNSTQVNAYSTYNPLTPNTGVIGDPGFSSTGTGSFGFPVAAGQTFTVVVHEITPGVGCPNYNFTVRYNTACRQAGFDRTNDGKADPTVFRPSTGVWYTLNSAGGVNVVNFGQNNDLVAGGDYTGDGQTDVAVQRPGNNTFYYGNNQTTPGTNLTQIPWGVAGDIAVPGDYDKDGKYDIAVWRPGNGTWYVLRSSDSTAQIQQWGTNGDIPVSGDFDGDLATDFAIVRPNQLVAGQLGWQILSSNFNYGFFTRIDNFGLNTDKIAVADFDGDAKTDIAVFRPSDGNWYVRRSSTGATFQIPFGTNGDIPQPADYDGDKIADFAVFRPSTGNWFIRNSQTGTLSDPKWGIAGDQPATAVNRIVP